MADVSYGDLEWEVDRGEHLSKENPPACQSCEEAKGAGCNLQSLCHFCVSQCGMPVCAGQDNESKKQSEENGHEDEVCPECADKVNQTQEAHKEEEEAYANYQSVWKSGRRCRSCLTKARMESGAGESLCRLIRISRISSIGVERWCQCRAKRKPKAPFQSRY